MRQGPLDGFALPEAPGVAVRLAPPAQRFVLRGAAATLAPLEAAFGVAPPAAPLSSASAGGRSAHWLGPDEWLLLAEGGPEVSEDSIDAALAGVFHSLVDVSHRQIGLEIVGARAAETLAFGVALDLHPSAFPVGQVARTLFVKAEITLWRREAELWRIEVARSFAPYAAEMLSAAISGLR